MLKIISMPSTRYLTKSKFKIALGCPTKLYYLDRKHEYPSTKMEDPFLEALAQGGFQVEELARMYHPGGHLITCGDYDRSVEETEMLLRQENVTIYEAAFRYNGLFVRVDILVKKGNRIELIEVKAKSFDPTEEYNFISKRGKLQSGWKEYLYDIAFQKYVAQQAHPEFKIKAFLMLADKTATTTIDGLNQHFKISKDGNNRTGIKVTDGITTDALGDPILKKVSVEDALELIYYGADRVEEPYDFYQLVDRYRELYLNGEIEYSPISKASCKGCEYKIPEELETEGKKSGFKQCWSHHLHWTADQFEQPLLMDIWNYRGADKLMAESKYFMSDVTEDDLKVVYEPDTLSPSHRQWIQVQKAVQKDTTAHIEKGGLKAMMDSFTYPLHFIDFETSAVAIPFTKGRRPYEQIAFQFSHHTVDADGTITHQTEFLCDEPGDFPNFKFVRALKAALEGDSGTIFRYHNHENNILCAIYDQLINSDEDDKEELCNFIKQITHSTGSYAETWAGERDMVDLYRMVKDHYYHPLMNGSISIKAVLPATINDSDFLKSKYSQPLQHINLTSKNFEPGKRWLESNGSEYLNPYHNLPLIFDGWTNEQLDATISDLDKLSDGGAALTAYGRLQFEEMSEEERAAIRAALLKYCELDTLAMVMIWEHWNDLLRDN